MNLSSEKNARSLFDAPSLHTAKNILNQNNLYIPMTLLPLFVEKPRRERSKAGEGGDDDDNDGRSKCRLAVFFAALVDGMIFAVH